MKVLLFIGILLLLLMFSGNMQEGFLDSELKGDRTILRSFKTGDNPSSNANDKLKDLKLNDLDADKRNVLITKYESGGPAPINGKDGKFNGDTTLDNAIDALNFRIENNSS